MSEPVRGMLAVLLHTFASGNAGPLTQWARAQSLQVPADPLNGTESLMQPHPVLPDVAMARLRAMIAPHTQLDVTAALRIISQLPPSDASVVLKRLFAALAVMTVVRGASFPQQMDDATRGEFGDGPSRLIKAAAHCRALDRSAEQHVLDLGPESFAMLRLIGRDANFKDRIVCLVNVTHDDIFINVDWRSMLGTRHAIHNLITGTKFNVHGPSLMMRPHQVMWATV